MGTLTTCMHGLMGYATVYDDVKKILKYFIKFLEICREGRF